jgi:hypothetical protein
MFYLPVSKWGQIHVFGFYAMFPEQVGLEIILPRPVLGLVLTLTQVTAEHRLVGSKHAMDTLLMPVTIVPRAEPFDSLGTVRLIALERLLVSGYVFSGFFLSVERGVLGNETYLSSDFVLA